MLLHEDVRLHRFKKIIMCSRDNKAWGLAPFCSLFAAKRCLSPSPVKMFLEPFMGPDHETTFKRVFFDNGAIRLQPLNPRYAPQTYKREQVAGMYRAIKRIQSLT